MSAYSGKYYSGEASEREVRWPSVLLLFFLWLAGALPELVVHIDTAQNVHTL